MRIFQNSTRIGATQAMRLRGNLRELRKALDEAAEWHKRLDARLGEVRRECERLAGRKGSRGKFSAARVELKLLEKIAGQERVELEKNELIYRRCQQVICALGIEC